MNPKINRFFSAFKRCASCLNRVVLLTLLCSSAQTALASELIVQIDEDADNNGYISQRESLGGIDCSLFVTDIVREGDRIRFSDGIDEKIVSVTADMVAAGRVPVVFAVPVNGTRLVVTARHIDASGAEIDAESDIAVFDVLANDTPVVALLTDADNSGFISAAEYGGEINVEVTLPATASVNDVVAIDDGRSVVDIVLGPLDLAFGAVAATLESVAEGDTASVLVHITDEAGNRSDTASDSAVLDTIAPPRPFVNPLLTASATPTVEGSMPTDADYLLRVTLNDVIYVNGDGQLQSTNGSWQLKVPNTDALEDGVYDIVATVIDIAGNSTGDDTVNELSVDLVFPQLAVDSLPPSNDAAPEISGTTDQPDGAVVVVEDTSSQQVCRAVVSSTSWACRPRFILSMDSTELVASVADAAGNVARERFEILLQQTSDIDGDGIADDFEGAVDTDGDGVLDYNDLDSDNDSIPDSVETAADHDGDGVRNYLDTDSDGDGVADLLEAALRTLPDVNRDGVIDRLMAVGDNGLVNVVESGVDSGVAGSPADTDGDGIADYLDYDSDNDGISDLIENTGSNSPQIISDRPMVWLDSDGDGVPNTLDYDSDQDGLTDLLEARLTDANNDHRIDNFIDIDRDGLADWLPLKSSDRDADGTPNFLDLDSDADNQYDLQEINGVDLNNDGIIDVMTDNDRNAVPDSVDAGFTGGPDQDDDAIDDRFDADFVQGADTDGDGIVDDYDPDANGDGAADLLDDTVVQINDSDGDSIPDVLDADIPDLSPLRTGTGNLGVGCHLYQGRATNYPATTVLLGVWLLLALIGYNRRLLKSLQRSLQRLWVG